MTSLFNLPTAKKPRERLQMYGSDSLSLEELVALILGTGSKKQDVLNLSSLVSACLIDDRCSLSELSALPGMGISKAAAMIASLQISRSISSRKVPSFLQNPESIYHACSDLLDLSQEHLVAFFATIRHQQISRETISIGTATSSLIHPREVFRPAILANASHIILAHNHPSGDPTPSDADRRVTSLIVEAGERLSIEVLDHVICARSGFISLKSTYPSLFQ